MDTFEQYRTFLFSIAYRMLGSVTEAEDMVQETYLRYQHIDAETVQAPKAFLSKIVTRLCLDYLKTARVQREQYIGTWLPEPLLTDTNVVEPAQIAEQHDSLSIAFLVLLEQLSPAERAVFLLHEVFDYEYSEIAEILGKQEDACRQLFSRAKQHLVHNRPRYTSTPAEHNALLQQFMGAALNGDVDGLSRLLARDVQTWADGGGKVVAALRPIIGQELVTRFFLHMMRAWTAEMSGTMAWLNGEMGLIIRQNGQVTLALLLETGDGLIQRIHLIRNPDKLKHLQQEHRP